MPVHVIQEDTGLQCEGGQGSIPAHQGTERPAHKKRTQSESTLSVRIILLPHIQAAASRNTALQYLIWERVMSQMDFFLFF